MRLKKKKKLYKLQVPQNLDLSLLENQIYFEYEQQNAGVFLRNKQTKQVYSKHIQFFTELKEEVNDYDWEGGRQDCRQSLGSKSIMSETSL